MPDEARTIKIDSPEKWTEANDPSLTKKVQIETLSGPATFEISALSGAEHQRILSSIQNPIPPLIDQAAGAPSENFDDQNYKLAVAAAEFKRMVMIVDLCWKELPGDDVEAKALWASENLWHRDELRQLFNAIIGLSGFTRPISQSSSEVPVIITDPKAWAEISRQPAELLFARPNGDKIVFDVRAVSRSVSLQIEMACPDPEVPSIPAPGHPGRVKRFVKNDKDPGYLAKVEAMENKRFILVLEASLPFKIPGDSFELKMSWLGLRPAGEINGLRKYIMGSANRFQERVGFM